jgi:hypothetical protein
MSRKTNLLFLQDKGPTELPRCKRKKLREKAALGAFIPTTLSECGIPPQVQIWIPPNVGYPFEDLLRSACGTKTAERLGKKAPTRKKVKNVVLGDDKRFRQWITRAETAKSLSKFNGSLGSFRPGARCFCFSNPAIGDESFLWDP